MADSVNINLGERKNGKSTQYVDCLHTVDDNYTAAGGLDVSSVDFEPTYIMSGLYLGAGAGNIAIEMEGGGQQILPFTVNSSLSILNDLSNPTWFANGCIEYLNIYNKIVDVNILKDIYQDPYAMVYKPNYLSNFIGAYAPLPLPTTMDKRHKHFGPNALPIGIGL